MDSNSIIEREKAYIDEISNKYDYDSNIRHLLYIIIPAFIIKYGIDKEKLVLNTFRDIRIISSNITLITNIFTFIIIIKIYFIVPFV